MWGSLRRSDRHRAAGAGALASIACALLAAGGGCSTHVLQVVAPDPCADGGAPGCVPPGLLDDLVGYWRLDDGTGSAVAHDWSGRANDGTLMRLDTATDWVAGRA